MNLKQKVETILEIYPPARDNDKILTLCIWKKFYGATDPISFAQIMKMPLGESVKRIRASIQNVEGRFLPSPSCKRKRQQQAKEYKKEFGKPYVKADEESKAHIKSISQEQLFNVGRRF